MAQADDDALSGVEAALGHTFRDRSLLVRALTHSSYANESGGTASDNETLEFLGDSILGFLVVEQLFEAFPAFGEGALSKARSLLVSESNFARLARALDLGRSLRLAVGESRAGGRLRDSLLADAFEAVFAALYLDAGLFETRQVVQRLFSGDIARLDPADLSSHDYKTSLQEVAQAAGKPLPVYRLVEESGPAHEKTFVFEVSYDGGALLATGTGASKKEAQRQAAKALLQKLAEATPED